MKTACRTLIVVLALVLSMTAWAVDVNPGKTRAATKKAKSKQNRVYVFGVVPQFAQRKLFSTWGPVIRLLEKETGLSFILSSSEQIPTFETRFSAGEFDLAYMNPWHVIVASSKQGYIPLVRDGSRKLQGILVVRKDSKVKSITDLRGKVLAFPSANALGASLLPRAELMRKHGIRIIPRYVKTHSSVYLHVARNLLVAGGGVKSTLNLEKPEVRDMLRIIYVTDKVNPHPIVAHPRVPLKHRKLITRAFMRIAKSPEGRKLLARIPMYKMQRASITDYNYLRTLNLGAIK